MYRRLVLLMLVLLFLGGCVRATFKPLIADYHAKTGASIAVIAGLENDATVLLTQYLIEELKEQSSYAVMPQSVIVKKLKGYPFDIEGPYKTAYFEIEMDFTQTDVGKLSQIQKILGVDYLFVLWAPISVSHNSGAANVIHVVTQMYEAPGPREVGRGRFYAYARKSALGIRSVTDGQIDQGLKNAAHKVAWELAAKTGMGK